MQVTFDTTNEKDVQDVQALVNMLTGGATIVNNNATSTAAAADEKPKAPTAAQKKAAQKKIDDAAAAAKVAEEEEAAAAAAEEATSEFSRDDVRAKLKEYAALEGKDGAIQILKDNGAASITELAEDKFAAVIEACG